MANYVQQVLDALDEHPATRDLDPELNRLYALLALVTGDSTTRQDVHDAWALWRNTTMPGHRSLVPFEDLAESVQALDDQYVEAVRTAGQH